MQEVDLEVMHQENECIRQEAATKNPSLSNELVALKIESDAIKEQIANESKEKSVGDFVTSNSESTDETDAK